MAATAEEEATHEIVAHVTASEKALFEQAAALRGRTLDAFIAEMLRLAAAQVVESGGGAVIRLDEEQGRRFAEALLAPPRPPNSDLKRAVHEYRDTVTEH